MRFEAELPSDSSIKKWNGTSFVSQATASRIVLIRKSLYSSRIFEETNDKVGAVLSGLRGVNLRSSPFPGLSLRRAALPSFSSPGKSFSFKIVHYNTVHGQAGDELSRSHLE